MEKSAVRFTAALLTFLAALFCAPAALAASAFAFATFDGIAAIRTTGDAGVTFTGSDEYEAFGVTTGGTPDPQNDGMMFFSSFTEVGEGTAANGGPGELINSSSLASSASSTPGAVIASSAFTFIDAELALFGTGTVEIDLAYTLEVDSFDNLPEGFAAASIEAYGTFTPVESAFLLVEGEPGPGSFLDESGVLTLGFSVDGISEQEPLLDFLTVFTSADATAAVVPVPAAAWLFGSAVLGLAGLRRRSKPGSTC
jgi:hypothetical protein